MNLLALFVWAVQIHNVTPVIHTLNYYMTVSQVAKLPEFLEAAYVDGIQIQQFDSNHRETKAKHDWVNKITEDNPYFWDIETKINIHNEQIMKGNIQTAKKRFNQTEGVHMIQVKYGCEWDDETGEVNGWEHHCYDGEDFLSFEAKTMTWVAAHPQAFITKLKWDQRDGENQIRKTTYTKMCPVLLKTHLRNGRDFLTRTELPKVSLLQKTPCSPVTCHATGFYPRTSTLFWRKNGEEIHEDVEMGETLPNHDGTFQTSAHLKVEVTPAAEQEYECVFRLAGGQEDIVIKLDAGSILSNQKQDWKNKVAIAVPLVVLNLVAMVMAVVVVAMILDKHLKRKQVIYSQACKEEKPKRKEEEEEGQLSRQPHQCRRLGLHRGHQKKELGQPRREGPFQVLLTTHVASKVAGPTNALTTTALQEETGWELWTSPLCARMREPFSRCKGSTTNMAAPSDGTYFIQKFRGTASPASYGCTCLFRTDRGFVVTRVVRCCLPTGHECVRQCV